MACKTSTCHGKRGLNVRDPPAVPPHLRVRLSEDSDDRAVDRRHTPNVAARLARRPFGAGLKVESQFRRIRARRNEVRSAERGQEVVYRGLVGQVDDREAQAPPVAVRLEQIVIAY